MKSVETIIQQEPVFLHNWKHAFDVLSSFSSSVSCAKYKEFADSLKDTTLLFCTYSFGSYDGSAWVLLTKDGKLYEVNGGHCSCYGLEGQWEPEEVTLEAIKHRIENGSFGKGDYFEPFDKELREFIGLPYAM